MLFRSERIDNFENNKFLENLSKTKDENFYGERQIYTDIQTLGKIRPSAIKVDKNNSAEIHRFKDFNIVEFTTKACALDYDSMDALKNATDKPLIVINESMQFSAGVNLSYTMNFADKGDMFFANRVQYPEVLPTHQNRGGLDFDPVSVAFASDIHMGSKKFLEKDWDKMMKWMNSNDETAKNIKYFVLSGDVVDGVGVYPGHDKNLSMNDVYDQYEYCARKLDELPDHITPVILPGNHDAVRPAEPQPMLEPLIQQRFNSAVHTGNPARIYLNHGQESDPFEVLSYHGKGIDDMVPRMAHVTYEAPAEAMKEMMKKRHLAPMWGERNALSPEVEDQMIIRDAPDLFVTGHTHAHQVEWYRGTPLVVSSTFQGETDFMQMLGYQPKKSLLTVYNLQSRSSRVISFES